MTFNSLQFAAFFVVVLLLYYRFGVRGQNRLMVVAGSVFYAAFDWRFLGLLYTSILVDFWVGRQLAATDRLRRRKVLLGLSLVTQLGILAVFKYFNFFAASVHDLLGSIGLSLDPVVLRVVLPVGISFYTFQTLAYVFAVYRHELDAESDLVTFAAFVAWFPQLVAGPIERATTLLPQIQRRRVRPDAALTESALSLILRGLFKKVVIADGVAAYVNTVYATPGVFEWKALALASIGFAVQVYGDFSGYSDIARGASRMLGVELRRNFEQPFLSRSMREFWQRWHTSLGWWFGEFVGRPLGGAGRGRGRTVFNTLVIFALIGLWHGPAWTFVFWGVLNGAFVAAARFGRPPRGQHPMKLRTADVPRIVWTFGLFCFGAIFFRAPSFHDGLAVARHLLTLKGGLAAPTGAELVFVMLGFVILLDLAERRARIAGIESTQTRARLGTIANRGEAAYESIIRTLPSVSAGVLVGVLAIGIVLFSGGAPVPFIYFKF